jgi:hypothetical protein
LALACFGSKVVTTISLVQNLQDGARHKTGLSEMNSAKINDWMQVVGIFAVVASLVFVGLQMKQDQEIALSNAYQARASTIIEMVTAIAANPEGLAAWYAPDSEGIDALTPEQMRAGTHMALALLLAYDNMFFQFENGFISKDGWIAGRTDMKDSMRFMFLRQYFESQMGRMRPSFKTTFVDVISELDAEQSG